MTLAHTAAIAARRLSYALDRAAFGHTTREQVEAELKRLDQAIEEWRKG